MKKYKIQNNISPPPLKGNFKSEFYSLKETMELMKIGDSILINYDIYFKIFPICKKIMPHKSFITQDVRDFKTMTGKQLTNPKNEKRRLWRVK